MSMNAQLRRVAYALLRPIVVDGLRVLRRPATGIDRVAANTVQPPPAQLYWGLHELDRQIEKYLDYEGGYYVELGANDGKLASNTLYYERSRNWRGVLIEPAPNLFIKCRENRSAKNHIVCAACVSFDYKHEFVKIIYSDSMSVSLNVETDVGDPVAHTELGRQFLKPGETSFTFGALATPLNSILLEAKAPKLIDFLSLDVEGAELEVLKGIDHDAFRFRYMLVECRDLARLARYLRPLQYSLLEKFNEHDYLFKDTRSVP